MAQPKLKNMASMSKSFNQLKRTFTTRLGAAAIEDKTAKLAEDLRRSPLVTPEGFNYAAFCKLLGVGDSQFASVFFATTKDKESSISAEAMATTLITLKHGTREERLKLVFDAFDSEGSGQLNATQLRALLATACSDNNVTIAENDLEEVTTAILRRTASSLPSPTLGFDNFAALVHQHPRCLKALRVQSMGARQTINKKDKYRTFKLYWRAYWKPFLFWSILIGGFTVGITYWVCYAVIDSPKFRSLAGDIVILARIGAAFNILTATFLLPPVSTLVVDTLRTSRINRIFNFDIARDIHIILGYILTISSVVHSISWFIAYANMANNEGWKSNSPEYSKIPDLEASSRTLTGLFTSNVSISGYIMLGALAIGIPFASKYPRKAKCLKNTTLGKIMNNFNVFNYTHIIMFVLFYVFLLLHPLPDVPHLILSGFSVAWVFVSIPLLVYIYGRIRVAYQRQAAHAPVVDAQILPGDVLSLRLQRPVNRRGQEFSFRTGQWVRINCPSLSRTEWHPFTLSSPTTEPHLTIHIKALGDWTNALLGKFSDVAGSTGTGGTGTSTTVERLSTVAEDGGGDTTTKIESGTSISTNSTAAATRANDKEASSKWPKIYLEGPYGAPAQDYQDYDILFLTAAGIGATPMVSILRDLVRQASTAAVSGVTNSPNNGQFVPKKAYFHWVVREQAAAQTWFEELLQEVAKADVGHLVEINIWYTGGGNRQDIRTTLLQLAQDVAHSATGVDILSGMETAAPTVHFGRPDWSAEFERIIEEVEESSDDFCNIGRNVGGMAKVGVFCCAPAVMESELRQLCLEHSAKQQGDANGVCSFDLRAESF